MPPRRHGAALAALVVAVLLAGCGTGSDRPESQRRPSSTPSPSSTSSPSASPGAGPSCPAGAQCFDFSDVGSGWAEQDQPGYFARQDPYLGGTFRVGARQPGSYDVAAPVKVSDVSPDLGVRLEADVVLGQRFPASAAWGASCWTAPIASGGLSGFAVFVQPTTATLGLWDTTDGSFKPLRKARVRSAAKPGQRTHLTLSCRRESSGGTTRALVDVRLGGARLVSLSYDRSPDHFDWVPADGIGMVLAGDDAEVFLDNVVIAPR